MKVLVGYATAYGSTTGIATKIGERLAGEGCQVDVRPVEEIDAVDAYDAVVLGSAVHDTTWLPQARAFVRQQRAALARRPVWLFSVSSVGDTSSFLSPRVAGALRQLRNEPKDVTRLRRAIRARDHRNFAGALERPQWGVKGRLFLKASGGRYGDHRDWEDIEEWARGIAGSLQDAADATPA
jgi:menaquinone-dependent protoporphyrinogen oxidase